VSFLIDCKISYRTESLSLAVALLVILGIWSNFYPSKEKRGGSLVISIGFASNNKWHRKSGWQSGWELDFYPSNPSSTPARVPTTKKKFQKIKITSKLPFMTSSRKAYLKKNMCVHLSYFSSTVLKVLKLEGWNLSLNYCHEIHQPEF